MKRKIDCTPDVRDRFLECKYGNELGGSVKLGRTIFLKKVPDNMLP